MSAKELIDYLNTLPSDTKITCLEYMADKYVQYPPSEVFVNPRHHLTYNSEDKTLKIGYLYSEKR